MFPAPHPSLLLLRTGPPFDQDKLEQDLNFSTREKKERKKGVCGLLVSTLQFILRLYQAPVVSGLVQLVVVRGTSSPSFLFSPCFDEQCVNSELLKLCKQPKQTKHEHNI